MRTFQKRRKVKNWISEDLKMKMKERDQLRERARHSGRLDEWSEYIKTRNECVKLVAKSKK